MSLPWHSSWSPFLQTWPGIKSSGSDVLNSSWSVPPHFWLPQWGPGGHSPAWLSGLASGIPSSYSHPHIYPLLTWQIGPPGPQDLPQLPAAHRIKQELASLRIKALSRIATIPFPFLSLILSSAHSKHKKNMSCSWNTPLLFHLGACVDAAPLPAGPSLTLCLLKLYPSFKVHFKCCRKSYPSLRPPWARCVVLSFEHEQLFDFFTVLWNLSFSNLHAIQSHSAHI